MSDSLNPRPPMSSGNPAPSNSNLPSTSSSAVTTPSTHPLSGNGSGGAVAAPQYNAVPPRQVVGGMQGVVNMKRKIDQITPTMGSSMPRTTVRGLPMSNPQSTQGLPPNAQLKPCPAGCTMCAQAVAAAKLAAKNSVFNNKRLGSVPMQQGGNTQRRPSMPQQRGLPPQPMRGPPMPQQQQQQQQQMNQRPSMAQMQSSSSMQSSVLPPRNQQQQQQLNQGNPMLSGVNNLHPNNYSSSTHSSTAIGIGWEPQSKMGWKPQSKKAKLKGKGGSSCHQCKSRRNFIALTYCTGNLDKKNKRCRKKFCGHCLLKFYKENAEEIATGSTWTCPSCRKICCCAACRRRQESPLALNDDDDDDDDDEVEVTGPMPHLPPPNSTHMGIPSHLGGHPMQQRGMPPMHPPPNNISVLRGNPGQYAMLPPNQRGLLSRMQNLPAHPITVNGQPYITAMVMGPPNAVPAATLSRKESKPNTAAKGKTAKGKTTKAAAKGGKSKKKTTGNAKTNEEVLAMGPVGNMLQNHAMKGNPDAKMAEQRSAIIIELENEEEYEFSHLSSSPAQRNNNLLDHTGINRVMTNSPSGPMILEFQSDFCNSDGIFLIQADNKRGDFGPDDQYLLIPTELLSSPGLKPLTPLVEAMHDGRGLLRGNAQESLVLEGFVLDEGFLEEHEYLEDDEYLEQLTSMN